MPADLQTRFWTMTSPSEPSQRRPLPTPEERSRRARQQVLGKRLGKAMGNIELQALPEDFLDLLRLADSRTVKA